MRWRQGAGESEGEGEGEGVGAGVERRKGGRREGGATAEEADLAGGGLEHYDGSGRVDEQPLAAVLQTPCRHEYPSPVANDGGSRGQWRELRVEGAGVWG